MIHVPLRIRLLLLVLAIPARAKPQTPSSPEPPGRVESAVPQSDGESSDMSLEEEMQALEDLLALKVTSAAKVEQKATEAPSILTLVTDWQIQEFGWKSINEILYRQPGFFPSQDYERKTVGARGMFEGWNNNHILFLIDGIPFNDNAYGTAFTWEITPLIFVKQLEIIRGPGSALYGTNATNGVVSIKTPRISEMGMHVLGQSRMGLISDDHFGFKDNQLYDVLASVPGKLLSFLASYSFVMDEGVDAKKPDDSGRTTAAGDLMKFKLQDRRNSQYFFAKLEGEGPLEGLLAAIHHQSWSFGTGLGWIFNAPDFQESMKEERLLASLSYRKKLNRMEINGAFRFQRHRFDWLMQYLPIGTTYPDYDENWVNIDQQGNPTEDESQFAHFSYQEGLFEYLKTKTDDIFLQAQLTYRLPREIIALGGIESSVFLYEIGRAHV
jgi:hypothetical protein